MKPPQILLAMLALILFSGSCTDHDETGNTSQALGPWGPAAWPGAWPASCELCGTNSPVIDGVAFYELALDRITANTQEVVMGKAYNDLDELVTVSTHGDVLLGTTSKGVTSKLGIGSTISVHRTDPQTNSQLHYELHIADIGSTAHWVGGGVATTYRMQYSIPGEEDVLRDLCPEVPESNPSYALPHHFVAFTGDRFDPYSKTVAEKGKGEGWLNFACWGSSIFKMHLSRHTAASASATHKSTVAQRQAMLKMYVADYCGDGIPHTVIGHPLAITDDLGWLPPMASISSIEAVWDENGATCLTVPRLAALPDISCAPSLDPCPISFKKALTMGHIFSANPL